MADFSRSFKIVLKHEGGYVNDPNDPGGETYKGIARNMNSKWDGWQIIDVQKRQSNFPVALDSNVDLQEKVEDFYRTNYWDRIKGDNIADDGVAASIFDFAVNAGLGAGVSLAQMVVGSEADGVMGNETTGKINNFDPDHFLAAYTVAKIARYLNIIKKRPSSQKYLYGWIRRALGII